MSFVWRGIGKTFTSNQDKSINKNTFQCWTYSKTFVITHCLNIHLSEKHHILLCSLWKQNEKVLWCCIAHGSMQWSKKIIKIHLCWSAARCRECLKVDTLKIKGGGGEGSRSGGEKDLHWLTVYAVLNQQNMIYGDLLVFEKEHF